MAILRPFRAWRPLPQHAAAVASRPYDVLDTEEARAEAGDNLLSFLHVVKPEIDLPPEVDPYSEEVYIRSRQNFDRMVENGVFFQEKVPAIYLYQQQQGEHLQTGFMALASVADYEQGVIKKHELTRSDKEADRTRLILRTQMQAEPVLFAYRPEPVLDALLRAQTQASPTYEFVAEDGVDHRLWAVEAPTIIDAIVRHFARSVPNTYVADGHHRTAAAASAAQALRQANPGYTGEEPWNYFLAVHFPADQLQIIDYNWVVRDLNGLSKAEFLEALQAAFEIQAVAQPFKPARPQEFGLYLPGQWYRLQAQPGVNETPDPVGRLDVSLLTAAILKPVLGIEDLRRDQRIDFVGGIRGLEALATRVDSGEMAAAFALFPVSMAALMDIADAGAIMPPKTTWFEPKLRSGLAVHGF